MPCPADMKFVRCTLTASAVIRYNEKEVILMDHEVLNELVDGLLGIMKPFLVRIVLYGSVARGVRLRRI